MMEYVCFRHRHGLITWVPDSLEALSLLAHGSTDGFPTKVARVGRGGSLNTSISLHTIIFFSASTPLCGSRPRRRWFLGNLAHWLQFCPLYQGSRGIVDRSAYERDSLFGRRAELKQVMSTQISCCMGKSLNRRGGGQTKCDPQHRRSRKQPKLGTDVHTALTRQTCSGEVRYGQCRHQIDSPRKVIERHA